jgi:fatty acid desaturase
VTPSEAYSAWRRTLDPAKRRAILELHHINPWWNLAGIGFVILWMLTGLLIVYVPTWLVRLPAYVLIGFLITGMANFVHEGAHGTLFKTKRWNRWWGFAMGVPTLFLSTPFSINHSRHHRYIRTEDDPDEFTNLTKDPRLLCTFYYLWLGAGMLFYAPRLAYLAIARGTTEQRKRLAVEQIVMLILVSCVLYLAWRGGWLPTLGRVWLIPLVFAMLIVNARTWAEHTLTVRGHPLTETRTITSTRLFSFLQINLNYHLEHHLFPGIPWYNLPKAHRILLDDYRAAGSSIYRSYTRFLFDAFRLGAHGVT